MQVPPVEGHDRWRGLANREATKQWITNGSYASTFLLFARTDPENDRKSRGVRALSCSTHPRSR